MTSSRAELQTTEENIIFFSKKKSPFKVMFHLIKDLIKACKWSVKPVNSLKC